MRSGSGRQRTKKMKRVPYKKILWVMCNIALIIGGFLFALNAFGALRPGWTGKSGKVIPVVSTRGHFRNGTLNPGHNAYDYAVAGVIPGLTPGSVPPRDLLIIVHGFNNTPLKAANVFALASDSLAKDNFDGEVIGFSWDANTQADPWNMTGFHECRRNACGNGSKLARFIVEYKERCPDTRVHVMGYSIGARLALEAALALENDPALARSSVVIDTIHLVGAAVDNEEVQTDERYGVAIENRVGTLYNYYSTEDNLLGVLYPLKETDRALGETDIEIPNRKPANYVSIDDRNELNTFDQAGRMLEREIGDNHCGCLGIWDTKGNLIDDGVMNLIVASIREFAGRETGNG